MDRYTKIKKYIEDTGLEVGDFLDPQHAAFFIGIPEDEVIQILEAGVAEGVFTKMYNLYCEKGKGFVFAQEEPFDFSSNPEVFCDLCGEYHNLTDYEIHEVYRINAI